MRVLVVEDEARMATLLERGFREEGYAVDVAGDGTNGLWLATENDYDAVVLDVMLPDLDGFESAVGPAPPAAGRRSCCSRRGTRWRTASAASTPAPTTT
jgi:AmiR/NasT family two-component response regulator